MENVQNEKSLSEQQNVSTTIKKICFEMLKLKQVEAETKAKYKELQGKVKAYCSKVGKSSLWFSENGKRYNITDVNPKKVIWDVEKLREKLPADVAKQVIETTYGINDWSAFVAFMKKHNIKPTEVIPFLTIERKVNQKKVDSLAEVGEITPEDIAGCYTVEPISGYVNLSEKEENADEEAG